MISLNHAFEEKGNKKNPKYLRWGFKVGDIIEVKVNFDESEALIKNGINSFVMSLDLEENDEIAAYVVLKSSPDTVAILNK